MAKAHKHGTMDVSAQEKAFAGFITASKWVSGLSIGVLVFLALVNS